MTVFNYLQLWSDEEQSEQQNKELAFIESQKDKDVLREQFETDIKDIDFSIEFEKRFIFSQVRDR